MLEQKLINRKNALNTIHIMFRSCKCEPEKSTDIILVRC